jgi:hypothetical protein
VVCSIPLLQGEERAEIGAKLHVLLDAGGDSVVTLTPIRV